MIHNVCFILNETICDIQIIYKQVNIKSCYIAWSSHSNAMQCCVCSNLISTHLRFTFLHYLFGQVSLWSESLALVCSRKQPSRITRMHHQACMDSTLTVNAFSTCSRTGWGGLSGSEVQRRAMHAHNDLIRLLKTLGINEEWCMQSMLRMAKLGNGIGSRRGFSTTGIF